MMCFPDERFKMTISTSRLYSGPADLHSMLDLLVAVKPAERIADDPSAVDLRELLALPAVQNNTRLWYVLDQPGGKRAHRLERGIHRSGGDASRFSASRVGAGVVAHGIARVEAAGHGHSLPRHEQRKRGDAAKGPGGWFPRAIHHAVVLQAGGVRLIV